MKRTRSRAKPAQEEKEEEDVEDDFGADRPTADSSEYYTFLGVPKTATAEEIRKAYQVHPDKNPNNKEEATKEFQKLAHIYSILGDETKRKFYDQFGDSGSAVEGLDDAKNDLDDFFGNMKKLRETDTVSPDEEKDLRKYFAELKGDEKKYVATK